MVLDIFDFHKKLEHYPASYLTPKEQEAFDLLLEYLKGIFGEKISKSSRNTQINIVKGIVSSIANNLKKDIVKEEVVKYEANNVPRRRISREVRFLVLARDNYSCQACGRKRGENVKLTVDHHTPRSKGGTDELTNLVTLCNDCNQGKGDKIIKIIKPTPQQVTLPIPIEYAVDQVSQILRDYRTFSKNNQLSIQQAIAVVRKTPPMSFNPLFYPLPSQAIIKALMAFEKDEKIEIKDEIIDFSHL